MAKKILVLASDVNSIICFRYHLIKEFVENGFEAIVCAPKDENEQKVINRLQQIGVNFIPLSLKRTSLNFLHDAIVFWKLCKIIYSIKPDIMFAYTIKPVIYGSLVARIFKIPAIYSMVTGLGYVFINGGFKIKILKFFVTKLYRLSLQFNTKVFFQNPDDLQLFVGNKIICKQKVVLINGSGVDVGHFYMSPLPNRITFLFIGRLIKDKGISEYFAAAKKIKTTYPEIRFTLIGYRDKNPTSLKPNELNNILSHGAVNYLGRLDDVRSALAEASVFVLPSYREGTPKSVLEAMSMGRPIITTDAPGCRETVVDGLNGFLVPIKNVEKLVEAMEKFILHPELMSKMGRESRYIAEDKYDVRKVNKAILKAMNIE